MTSDELREAYRQFTTGVALITTHGRRGPNVMAAEWTFNVSYDPFLISVHIRPEDATHEAIEETGEFGVNIVAEDQVASMALAGHFTGYEVQKLSSHLFETYQARRIRAPMIKGCLLNAECRLVDQVAMGDHTAFIGEVVGFDVDGSRRPVILHRGARRLGPRIRRGLAVAVAVTPMEVSRKSKVSVTGELMAPSRESKRILVALLSPGGVEVAEAEANTDARGYFRVEMEVPADAEPGSHRVVARYRGVEGTASLEVS